MKKVYLIALFLLVLRLAWFSFQPKVQYPSGVVVTLQGTVGSQPQQQQFILNGIRIKMPSQQPIRFLDEVRVEGLVKNGVMASPKKVEVVTPSRTGFWWEFVDRTRSNLIKSYQRVLPKVEADLLAGIVLGNQGLDRNLKDKMIATGLTHIIAASGMNVTFIAGLAIWIMNMARLPKWLRVILGTAAIFFYACLAGLGPPIVRAMIMGVFALTAVAIGRQSSGWVGLGIAAFVMLWVSPDLITSPSFLLSFTAMISQVSLSAIRVKVPKLLEPVIGNFLQSFSAIVFTLPIVIIYFGRFSISSFVTNVLVLWTIEPLMILGVCVGGTGLVFTELSRVFSWPASALLKFFLWVVSGFAGSEGNVVHLTWTDPALGLLFALGYYLFLGILISWVLTKRQFMIK